MAAKIKWHLEEVRAGDLKPNPNNPKIRDEAGMRRLRKLTDKYGLIFSGVVNKDLTIIDGHSRSELVGPNAKVHVFIPSRQLAEEEYKEINAIYDLARAGQIDMQILEEQFTDEFFDEWELESKRKIDAEEDNYQIPEKIETDIKVGDLITIGKHRLVCGDCREQNQLTKLMAGKQADLVLTDPPYNVDYEGSDGQKIMNDKMDGESFYFFLYNAFVSIFNNTKPGGAWYIWHADSEGKNFRAAMTDAGIPVRQCLVWVKNSLVMGRQDYQWKHEPCLYGWKEGAGHYFTPERTKTTVIEDAVDYKKLSKAELLKIVKEIMSDKTISTVIHCDKPTKNDLHPTMKPILLLAPLIENSSTAGQLVLDTFAGSGSTMVTCHQMKRTCYAMDNDPKYCHVIIDRMLALDPTLKVKINGKEWKQKG